MSGPSDELPNGWVKASLGDLLVGIVAGKSPQAAGRPAEPGEFGVLKVSAVSWGVFKPRENKAMLGEVPANMPSVSRGDLLISRANTSELVGAVVLVPKDYPHLLLSDKTLRLDVSAWVSKEYLLHGLRTAPVRKVFEELGTGTSDSMRNLSHDKIKSAPVSLAPLSEQKRIVTKIEALQARSDAAREALDAIPPLLEKFRQSVLAAAFRGDLTKAWRQANPDVEPATELLARIRAERRRRWEEANPRKKYVEPEPVVTDGLPELPEGWCWASLEELMERVQTGPFGSSLHKSEYVDGGIPVVNPQHLKNFGIAPATAVTVADSTVQRLSGFRLQAGDVVLGRRGEMGRCAVVGLQEAGWLLGTGSLSLRLSKGLAPSWFAWFLRCPSTVGRLEGEAVGSTMTNLNQGILLKLPVPLPPTVEQDELTHQVEAQFSAVDDVVGRSQAVSLLLSNLGQSILAKAFRGELVPQDPTDEPASVLLERIRGERASGEGGAGGGKGVRRGRKGMGVGE
jgi:type I restriction enzyme S subunit